MNSHLNFSVGPAATAPTAYIKKIEPQIVDAAKCEGTVNLGVFFDGTNNNRDRDARSLGDTNIVRLFRSYSNIQEDGYYRLYVPGVGTRFPEIGEEGESLLGGGFAIGCESRVLYALCWIIDSLYRTSSGGNRRMSDLLMRALCRNKTTLFTSIADDEEQALHESGYSGGMLMPDTIGEGCRVNILKGLAEEIEYKQRNSWARKVLIKECFIDVFGFSRGAAQARVFCNWLEQIVKDGKVAGIPIHFRFLGIMDTVASAGFFAATGSKVVPMDGAHSGWAGVKFLRISKSVKNCVHMIAMHELRKNFPLDSVSVDGVIPPNCREYAYPGVHSDVGGGYTPGALGVSVGATNRESDALKLAQIPLNHMFDCAVAAGAPMSRQRANGMGGNDDRFAIHPRVQAMYDDFVKEATLAPRPLREWMQPYINWRWQIRHDYHHQAHVRRANEQDRQLLLKFNTIFVRQAAGMDRTRPKTVWEALGSIPGQVFKHKDALEVSGLDPEAQQVYALAKNSKSTTKVMYRLFDEFVHDSMAGFDLAIIEGSGYWRYRKGYLGQGKALIASNDTDPSGLSKMA